MKLVKNVFLLFAIAFAQLVAQFLAWSFADRTDLAHAAWTALGAPLFFLTRSLTNEHFWAIAIANSFLWAALLTWLARRLSVRALA